MSLELRMIGAVVDKSTALAFAEKCKPHETTDVIETLVKAVVNGDIRVSSEKKS